MGTWKHRISDVNPVLKTGKCSNCGEVELYFIPGTKRWQCRIAKREKRNRYRTKRIGSQNMHWKRSREQRLLAQDGKCTICGDTATSLDHCHESGQLRDALCSRCNLGLGLFRDNPFFVKRAAEYLFYYHKINGVIKTQ